MYSKELESLVKILLNTTKLKNIEIAKKIYEERPDLLKNIKLSTFAKRVSDVKNGISIINEKEIENSIKVIDSDLEITKKDWIKRELNEKQLKDKLNEKEKINKVLKQEIENQEKIIDGLNCSIPNLPNIEKVQNFQYDKKKIDEDVVMVISDVHAGEVVNPYEMEHMGEYNFEIMCNRVYFLCEKTIEIVENQKNISNIRKLYIDFLGDIVHGEIHQKEFNEFPIIPVVLNTSYVLSQAIAMMSKHFEEIEITCVVGNHGRLENKPPSKGIYNNWDYLIYKQIEQILSNYKNIKFNIPLSPAIVVDRMDRKFLLTHGDSIRGGFAGIPVYGMIRNFANQQELRRSRGGFDYMEIGHYHQDLKLKDGKLIVNGSLVGNSEFNLNRLNTTSEASQKIYGINKKYGVSWERNIKVEHANQHKFKYSFNE